MRSPAVFALLAGAAVASPVVKDRSLVPDVEFANPTIPADTSRNALEAWIDAWDVKELGDEKSGYTPANTTFPPDPPTDPKPETDEQDDTDYEAMARQLLGYGAPYVEPAFTLSSCNGSPCPCSVTTYHNVTSCITNYNASNYANNERCVFTVDKTVTVFSVAFDTEGYWDRLIINGQAYSGRQANGLSGPNGIQVTTGSNITWSSDVSVGGTGFTVCVAPAFEVVGSARNTQCNVTLQNTTNAPCIQNLAYGNNEACTFAVTSTVVLNPVVFSTENNYDQLYVNGMAYSGNTGPNGVRVAAGSKIYWKSDYSVSKGGFLICVTPAFEILNSTPTANASGPCLVTSGQSGESCMYDRNYGNDERCTAQVTLSEVMINTVTFDTEQNYDHLTIAGQQFTGTNGPKNFPVNQNATISWYSDYSITHGGWEICADLESACTATCNSDGSVNLPAVQFAELLAGYGQPGNYQGPAPLMENACCAAQGGFCGTNQQFHDNQCRNAIAILVNELGYTGPALTCKFYSCTLAGQQLPVFSRLAFSSAAACNASASTLANRVCHPPPRTTPHAKQGFLCSATDECVNASTIPGTGPMEGVSLSTCRSTCGASAGRYECKGALGCQLSSMGTSLFMCQQRCR